MLAVAGCDNTSTDAGKKQTRADSSTLLRLGCKLSQQQSWQLVAAKTANRGTKPLLNQQHVAQLDKKHKVPG